MTPSTAAHMYNAQTHTQTESLNLPRTTGFNPIGVLSGRCNLVAGDSREYFQNREFSTSTVECESNMGGGVLRGMFVLLPRLYKMAAKKIMKPRPRLLFLTWMFVHLLNLRDLEFPKVLKMAVWVCCYAAKEID